MVASSASLSGTEDDVGSEEWREVPDLGYGPWKFRYEVSSLGNVRSWSPAKRGDRLKVKVTKHGYHQVNLVPATGSKYRSVTVHTLVSAAYIGPRPGDLQVCHLDGNPANNVVSNLRYGTASSNTSDSVQHGTHANAKKTYCPQNHPYDEANTWMVRGRRRCRACLG